MRIDLHAHYWTDDYLDLLVGLGKADTGTQRGMGAGGGDELEARLELMDRAGVEMQVLSASPQLPHGEDRRNAVAAARFVNDQYAELVERHPARFRAFAALPMPHIDESIAEMGRALEELGMVGVALNTTVLGRALVESVFEPIFAELDRRASALFLHPAGNNACSPLIGDHGLTWTPSGTATCQRCGARSSPWERVSSCSEPTSPSRRARSSSARSSTSMIWLSTRVMRRPSWSATRWRCWA
jgi:6-methylsalicylate decarboxylase